MARTVIKLYLLSHLVAFSVATAPHSEGSVKTVCDDGKYGVAEELGNSTNWNCGGQHLVVKEFDIPAGETKCRPISDDSSSVCMGQDIEYQDSVPSSGSYRPLPPMYGEYDYLPQQRWLHALKLGAIAFLYHPCAPEEQVRSLRQLAWSCLRKYVMTPYPGLSTEQPLALVSWGCVYHMSWVDKEPAKQWIREHALQAPDSEVVTDGQYSYGLTDRAVVVSTLNDSVLCPEEVYATIDDPTNKPITHNTGATETSNTSSHEPVTVAVQDQDSTGTPCPLQNTSQPCGGVTVVVMMQTHPILTAITVTLVLATITVLGIVMWTCHSRWCGGRRRAGSGRYKTVSNFFPSGRAGDTGVRIAIPELGVPKAMSSEREKLLMESDEDEL